MYIAKGFKNFSHHTKKQIEDMQKKHYKDILQPRDWEGNINPEFVREYGLKHIIVSDADIAIMAKKDKQMAKYLTDNRNGHTMQQL